MCSAAKSSSHNQFTREWKTVANGKAQASELPRVTWIFFLEESGLREKQKQTNKKQDKD